ncbi:MAG: Rrf2 family transcriptional regulator [Arhodomonas sp.]|nr:Rrf2 family transcriptional regulator [Arhodomonas sp.]
MRLTSKARYAVDGRWRSLPARGVGGDPAELGEQQGVSLSYLEQLFAALRRANLVSGVRGPGGGYRLARAPAEISVADIISAVDAGWTSIPTSPGALSHP